ncbi:MULTISPECIES: S8 family peptidase [unclassified Pseudomonas]|uniref:S8 family peptidase n=1 Tax=unclassified Pseudomonas TaxID=196821 RepID=UPI000A1F1D21|nr:MULTISPECIES: S8 family peptidase [unclassified Pseudomonas]
MAEKPRNLLIANGHELIGQLSWPKGGGKKWLPYSINDAREALHNQILEVAKFAGTTQERFAPRREITAKVILHPSFLAKSYFPSTILRDSGLSILGSRPVNITPRVGRSETPKNQETASIFVSGTAESFRAMDDSLLSTYTSAGRQEQFARIELICPYQADEKLRISVDTRWPDYIHVTMHATEADADILTAFKNLVEALGGRISGRGFRFVPGLTFVAVQIPPDKIHQVAQFTRIRLVRSLPEIQEEWKLTPAVTKAFGAVETPTDAPKSSIKTAIFDGGIANAFPGYATEISSTQQPSSSIKDLSHGVNVTSAFLYGHVKPDDKYLPVPFCHVDHHRVLPTSDNPEQALDILDRVITALRSAKVSGNPYRFANISLGPVATFFDDDVHEWTSRLDTELADGQTLCTTAVGNNGFLKGELGRIQPPGDAVNVFAVGAADSSQKKWNKAPYSAVGPGRSPGYVKPDIVAFGGSNEEPLPVFNPLAGSVVSVAGTSFASPLALRVAVGADVLSGSVFEPITLQALMINGTEFTSRNHSRSEVGWGRIPLDPEEILFTPQDVVRVVYQGVTRPGHPQKALIPVPKGLPAGAKITIGATFCYRAPVDAAHAINYTRAGLWVRAYKAPKKSMPLFGGGMYKTEEELRKDSMRWDTVLHAKRKVDVDDLDNPYFHINYQVRDEGEAVRLEDSVPMPYALVVTIEAPGVLNLLSLVQAEYPVLQTLSTAGDTQTGIQT